MSRMILLETERLTLRQFEDTEADRDFLVALDADPEVRRFLDQLNPPTQEDAARTLKRFLERHELDAKYGYWIATVKGTEDEIGWFHFRPSGKNPDEIELGYRLLKSEWGKGYATEGSRALIEQGFSEYGLNKVIATTLEANVASRHVLEKCGMTVIETYLHDDRLPAVKYEIIRAQS